MFDILGAQAVAMGFSFFLAGTTSLFLITTAYADRVARSFAIAVAYISLWGLFGFLFHITETLRLATDFRAVSVGFIPLLTAALNQFAEAFYRHAHGIAPAWARVGTTVSYSIAIIFTSLAVSDALLDTRFIIAGVSPSSHSPLPGVLLEPLIGYFFAGAFYTGWTIWRAKKGAPPHVRTQVNIMLGSIFGGLLIGGTRFATWYSLSFPPVLFALAPFVFIGGTFYAITRHELFKIKVAITQLLVFGIWTLAFFRVLLADTWNARIIEGSFLVALVILGVLLIRNVLGEVSHREKLELVTHELQTLNAGLEEKVSERTQALSRAKAHTDTVIEHLTIGLVEYDHNFTVLRMNKTAERLLGVMRTEVVGTQVRPADIQTSDLMSVAQVSFPSKNGGRVVPQSTPADPLRNAALTVHELSVSFPQKRELEVTTVPITDVFTHDPVGFVKLIRDMTAEKTIDRRKSTFISVAAHQLRTPLSAMKWAFNLLLENTRNLTESQLGLLTRGEAANENMIHIVNDLLDVSRIENEEGGFSFRQHDLVRVVKRMVRASRLAAEQKSLNLSFDADDAIPQFLFDDKKIALAVKNVIENAVNYTPQGDISVAVSCSGAHARVSVTDTGIGIPQDELDRVFTRFYRSKQAIHIETDRSGLGLFIVKSIVDRHGGEVGVDSAEGKGTTIWFTLPIRREERGEAV